MGKWKISVNTETDAEEREASTREEVKGFLESHHGMKYTIHKTSTGELYESGVVDASAGEDLEYAH